MTNLVLFLAIVQIESGGNDNAIGDNGRAIGPAQIRAKVIRDVNRFYKTRFTLRDAKNRKTAFSIFNSYLWIYATPERLGRAVTDIDRARIWNGGPAGWRKPTTLPYAKKVQQALVQLNNNNK